MNKSNKNNFSLNKNYKDLLKNTNLKFYSKYIDDIITLKKINTGKFLDCGCGTGNVLRELPDTKNNYGIDISEFFIKEIKSEGYNVLRYDGVKLPFSDESFDIVGSFTVLEHVENPSLFIIEQGRVLKRGGYMIVACPNFLSPFNNVRSYSLRYKFISLLSYYLSKSREFVKMEPIAREGADFIPDDDAIVQTNPIQLINFLKNENLKIIKFSGVMSKNNLLFTFISVIPLARLFLPSCYVVCKKV